MPQVLPQTVFKAYDIRGTVPDQLNESFAYLLGRALARRALACGTDRIVVGFDGRLSSPGLSESLQKGMRDEGIDTVDIGMVPTPLVYFESYSENIGAAVAITGSHNPPRYNGFKMMIGGKALYGDDVLALREEMQALASQPVADKKGGTHRKDIVQTYIDRIVSDVKLVRPMKIAIDCGNGVAGIVATKLFRALSCQVTELFCDVDGAFPNHHPDPADPHNLEDLQRTLEQTDCEIGLAFDGDGDRLGVVTRSGSIIWPDRQLILFARDILARQPGATIIYDVKCSRHVTAAVKEAGGEPLMWRTGHSLIKAKLAETGAPIAGEMSGHVFFKERWFGFDDGLYTGARLLEILARDANPTAVLDALPEGISTPELKLDMQEGQQYALIKTLQEKARFPGATSINTIDGVRAEYEDGFGLARASNTTPVIVLRFEGDSQEAIDRIRAEFKAVFAEFAPDASLPF
ncbi:phosphoglucomutase [Advenella kashmirensis W13003]|uniref:Phosphoglucomutase n=1 Tax=Advenella kashmirensis W13003 TaxID=1424334 RepID=V8QW26_9BURK|nr:phosphomannomutase/phosphoglucomutase [Advenella kashmirensis]ETF03862.1 phosphoglucomutase [Advenella kashmirensis W13003]